MKLIETIARELLEKGLPASTLVREKGLTLYLLAKKRPFVGKFILELLYHTPLKNVHPNHISLDIVQEDFLLATIHFEESSLELQIYLERLIYELEWGVRSPYHATRILEMKALSMDEKRELIQDHILRVIRRFPKVFDYDLFSEMQQFFLSTSDQYYRSRSVREVGQTVMAFYLMRKKVAQCSEKDPERRHVFVKVMRRTLSFPLEIKETLEVTIGMNTLKDHEVFKKSHLLKAVQNILPEAEAISGSDYKDKEGEHLLTLEVEKEGGFTNEEIRDFKRWLPRTLRGKVEHLQRSLFMPRNEEEILRHTITLGKELRFARDAPQVILSFEKQNEASLIFTVILARILLPKAPPTEEILLASALRPKIDRIKQLGVLRKRYPKEAVVSKVELPILPFLREDHSVDLYKARESILRELRKVFGEIRDFNGGMISRQNETFTTLEKLLGETAKTHHLLLENFFHSLSPLEKRSFIDPKLLKTLFELLIENISSPEAYLSRQEAEHQFLVGELRSLENIIECSSPLIAFELEHEERAYRGFVSALKIGLLISGSNPLTPLEKA